MSSYIALLRAINLGKRQLAMKDLRRIATDLGLESPRTYISSGNLLFRSSKSEGALKRALESAISEHMSAHVDVMIRTAEELAETTRANPFADEPSNRVVAIFLDEAPAAGCLLQAKHIADERLALGKREIFVHYPSGQSRSKLKIPAASAGTARNLNTVTKLVEITREMT